MSDHIILVLCILIILSYLFDITARYSKVPGVILLIIMGIGLQVVTRVINLEIPDISVMLPVLGTLGLIMIVMEASLDLRLEKGKRRMIMNSISSAFVLFAVNTVLMTLVLCEFFSIPLRDALLNSIPAAIISSSVAISSSGFLNSSDREFVVYESSFSDIFGIIVFDLILLSSGTFGHIVLGFLMNSIITIIISVFTTAILAVFLHKVSYHINYVIIMTAVVLIYTLAKLAHLPSLLVVLAFGLILANSRFLDNTPVMNYIDFNKLRVDLDSFRKIVTEFTFIVRSFFFIMFGYYTKVDGLFDSRNFLTALSVTAGIFILRAFYLKFIVRIPLVPLLFFVPRGLITILLFLSVPVASRIEIINDEVITLIILLSIIILITGNFIYKKEIVLPAQQPDDSVKDTIS